MKIISLDDKGLTYADYPTILSWLQEQYKQIFGQDIYLEADSQDGQWLAVQALAMYDLVQVAASIYNSFSPLTAQGDALSRNVKINGIARQIATKSTVDLRIVGQVGSVIKNGIVEDELGQKWFLPTNVVVPVEGEIVVTAIAEKEGAITAQANTITKIITPSLGWQTVTNPLPATAGVAIESDAALRRRQAYSTALPALSVFDSTIGAVFSLAGVERVKGYENDSNVVDDNGIPPHSIALVVEGGDVEEIAKTIAAKKTPGTGTFGDISIITYDQYGEPNKINFFRSKVINIYIKVVIKPLTGYTTKYAEDIAEAIKNAINSLEIGEAVLLSKLYVPANLSQSSGYKTFDITSIALGRSMNDLEPTNIDLAFNEVAYTDLAFIEIVETP